MSKSVKLTVMFYSHECTKFFSKKLLFGKFCHKKKQPRLSRFNPICHFKTEERAPVTQREREREREREGSAEWKRN